MSISLVKRPPPDLPPARLYLDDLNLIEKLIRDAYASLATPKVVSFEYEVDEIHLFTTTAELAKAYDSSANLIIFVSDSSSPSFRKRILSIKAHHVSFSVPVELRQWESELRRTVDHIVTLRRDQLKMFSRGVPAFVKGMGLGSLSFLTIYFVYLAFGGHMPWHWPYLTSLAACFFLFLDYADARKNRVYFRKYRDIRKASAASRKEMFIR